MPLSFLTADRAFDETASDTALPFEDRDRWRRPYRPGPWRVGFAAVLLLLASYVLAATVIIVLSGGVTAAGVCAVMAVAIIAGALRLLRMGTWVSARGLRRVGFFATRTTAWRAVTAVRTAQQPVRWLGLPRTVQGQALLLSVSGRGGEPAQLMTTHNADFLAREEAFDRAADTIEAWAAEYGRP